MLNHWAWSRLKLAPIADSPSWLSRDACQLWVIHFNVPNSGIGNQIHIYDR